MQRLGKQGCQGLSWTPVTDAPGNNTPTFGKGGSVHWDREIRFLLGTEETRRFYTLPVVLVGGINKGGLGWLEDVIGHGIVGKDIPIMARLTKVRRWSKR
jgi:hypothetical protein